MIIPNLRNLLLAFSLVLAFSLPAFGEGSVIMANGTYELSETDLTLPARGIAIEWTRNYRSNRIKPTTTGPAIDPLQDGPLGYGWTTAWFAHIENGDTWIDGDGLALKFNKDSSGAFIADTAEGVSLTRTAAGYELLELGVGTHTFNTAGKLVSFRDLNGNTVTVNYDAQGRISGITDATGRQALSFAHNASGRIASVTDAAGRTVAYQYDAFGNLATVTKPGNAVAKYACNAYHGISSITNALDETTTVEYQYPESGVVKRVIDPAGTELLKQGKPVTGHAVTYSYDFKNGTFFVTDKNGVTPKKTVNAVGALVSEEQIDGASTKPLKKIEYLQNRTERITDGAGIVTTIQRDEWYNIIRVTDSLGNETRTTWTPLKKPNTVIDPLGTVTRFEYDAKGNLVKQTMAEGKPEQTVTQYTYDSYGQLTQAVTGAATLKIAYNNNGMAQTITDPLGNVSSLEYDTAGNILSRTDANGNKSTFTYDEAGNLRTAKNPLGQTYTYFYNAENRPTKMADPLEHGTVIETDFGGRVTATIDSIGHRKEYTYDGNGNLIKVVQGARATMLAYDASNRVKSVTDPEGNTTTYQYPGDGCQSCTGNTDIPVKITDPLGNITENLFDKAGRLMGVKDPLENITAMVRNAAGKITAVQDANGNTTTYKYDALGRLVKKIDANYGETSLEYNSTGKMTSFTDASGNITRFEYDLAGRKTKEILPMGQAVEFAYYPNGLVKSMKNTAGQTTSFTYDAANRLKDTVYPDGGKETLDRDAAGRVIVRTDSNGNKTHFEYDELDRVSKQTDANNGETRFGYDEFGNLATLTDANGNISRFEYDLTGKIKKEIRPMGQAYEYTYYRNGLLKTAKDGKGQVTTYIYDPTDRLTEVRYADGKNSTYGYGNTGNMTSYSGSGVSGSITYDTQNRKLSETVNFGLFSKTYNYTYDGNGNKASFTTPEGKIYSYTYNQNNRLAAIGFEGKTIGFEYELDRLTKMTLPNGVSTDYAYNANSWLAAITTKHGTSTLSSSQYGFDKVGNITNKTTEQGDHLYGYDPTYKLSAAISPALPAESYSYDKTGNRQNATVGSSTTTYTHNANHELTSDGGATRTYDTNGNTASKTTGGQTTIFTHNAADRLETVQLPDGTTATYTYDSFGRRIKKQVGSEVTYYLYSDEGLIGEYDANGSLKKGYGWIPDGTWGTDPVLMTEGGRHYYYHNDHLGTPKKITDDSGSIVWSAEYAAFGKAAIDPAPTVTNNLRFPGQYFDEETGLHYNWHRFYEPDTGRYLSIDPIGPTVNPYIYASANPLNRVDPEGLFDYNAARNINNLIFNWGSPVGWMYQVNKFTENWVKSLSPTSLGGQLYLTWVSTALTVVNGILDLPRYSTENVINAFENPTGENIRMAIPLFGPVGVELGNSLGAVWENPGDWWNWLRLWGAAGQAVLLGRGGYKGVKGCLLNKGKSKATSTSPGAQRAARFSEYWKEVSLKDTVKRIAGDNPVIETTTTGKTVYRNAITGAEVVYDTGGNYFRVRNSAGQYVDEFGKTIPDNVPLIKPDKITQTGVPKEVRQSLTHFRNSD